MVLGRRASARLRHLIAFRPEAWRFLRLAEISGAAKAIAEAELGPGSAAALLASMAAISDYKGDFSVYWKETDARPIYERIVDRALAIERETEVLHFDEADIWSKG
jgi:hypothetical protein